MRCEKPFVKNGQAFPCRQCLPCTINRRREWTHRIKLEAAQYQDNAFVTLTYSDDYLPPLGSLEPLHLQLWLKIFRKEIAPLRIRYYACGEYGEHTQRPHYHLAIFGYPHCRYGLSRYQTHRRRNCCSICDLVRDTWGKGFIEVGMLSDDSAAYVAQYVTKKMTRTDDVRLNGRWPEFARMSLRPGIGYDALHEIASEYMRLDLSSRMVDVPSTMRHGPKELPLGNYLTKSLRKLVGGDGSAPQEVKDLLAEKMRPMREAAFENSRSLKEEVIASTAGNSASAISRFNIHRKRKFKL